MNKNTFVKFSLTVLSAAVLAACSSGGNGGNGGNDTAKLDAQKQAQLKAEAEKAAAAKAKEEAEKAAQAQEAKVKSTTSVGHKLVKKTESNFVLNIKNDLASSSSGRSDNMSIELYPSLDTVVVSVPLKKVGDRYVTDEKAPIGYLEDFDFRGNTTNTSGKYTLSHIYKTADGSTKGSSSTRTANETKTASVGTDRGQALVYQETRKVYIPTDERVNGAHNQVELRDRSGTVAEVYGHRTFVEGNSLTGRDANGKVIGSEKAFSNAPFGAKDANGEYTKGVKLNNVQYGRVTSRLDKVERDATKDGLNAGAYNTKVVSYGEYGVQGTENSYFYRGIDDTAYNADLAGKLADTYATYNAKNEKVKAGQLTYQGHAVTYGFEHSAPKANTKDVPNALSAEKKYQLVSGTHVTANIDLATKAVTGNLYDVWSKTDSNVNVKENIATFSGKLENNGSIAGTSKRVAGGEGTLNANLFGTNAEELGGALASKATDARNSWGAVFGAKVQNTGDTPQNDGAWGIKTDENQ